MLTRVHRCAAGRRTAAASPRLLSSCGSNSCGTTHAMPCRDRLVMGAGLSCNAICASAVRPRALQGPASCLPGARCGVRLESWQQAGVLRLRGDRGRRTRSAAQGHNVRLPAAWRCVACLESWQQAARRATVRLSCVSQHRRAGPAPTYGTAACTACCVLRGAWCGALLTAHHSLSGARVEAWCRSQDVSA